jgi:hypothetical protein
MQNNLLDFFNSRSELLKSILAFTSSSDKEGLAKYKFIVSNYKQDEDNTIEIDSLDTLNNAVEEYFSNTEIEYKGQIKLSELLDVDKSMYVHLQLT